MGEGFPLKTDSRSLGIHLQSVVHATHVAEETVAWLCDHEIEAEVNRACTLVSWGLGDSFPSEMTVLRALGFKPTNEIVQEFHSALLRCLSGDYRAVRFHLRLGLEMAAVGSGLLAAIQAGDSKLVAEAREWTRSDGKTPRFSSALRWLKMHSETAELVERDMPWIDGVQDWYWALCDYTHVRGETHGLSEVQPAYFTSNSVPFPTFSADRAQLALNEFVKSVRWAATLTAMANPMCVVGLPIADVLGPEAAIPGLLQPSVADLYREMITDQHRDVLVGHAAGSSTADDYRNWLDSHRTE